MSTTIEKEHNQPSGNRGGRERERLPFSAFNPPSLSIFPYPMFDFILMHFPALSVSPLQYIHDMMGGGLTATDLKLLGTNRLCKDHRNWCRTTRGCACPSLGSLPLSGFSHFDPKQCSTDPRFRALSLPLPFVLLCISISSSPSSSPLLPDPFLIVLFLPQSPPMPLFHPPAPALQPSLFPAPSILRGELSPFQNQNRTEEAERKKNTLGGSAVGRGRSSVASGEK